MTSETKAEAELLAVDAEDTAVGEKCSSLKCET